MTDLLKRKPGHCPMGHPCATVNALVIKCDYCDFLDDSTMADLYSEQGGFKAVPR